MISLFLNDYYYHPEVIRNAVAAIHKHARIYARAQTTFVTMPQHHLSIGDNDEYLMVEWQTEDMYIRKFTEPIKARRAGPPNNKMRPTTIRLGNGYAPPEMVMELAAIWQHKSYDKFRKKSTGSIIIDIPDGVYVSDLQSDPVSFEIQGGTHMSEPGQTFVERVKLNWWRRIGL